MAKEVFINNEQFLQKKMIITLQNDDKLDKIATALNSKTRRNIISLLTTNSYTVLEIAERLNMSLSNISFHVNLLKNAGLVNMTHNYSKRGNEKIIALEKHCLEILFVNNPQIANTSNSKTFQTELPVGSFNVFDIVPPCGMADSDGLLLGAEAAPDIFYNYKRLKGEIIWFTQGYLEYHFANSAIQNKILNGIQISLELCSECANYNNSFKSDITFSLNGKEVGTYTSPGDFGGRMGKLTPKNWPMGSTQYGMLVQIRIDEKGIWINQNHISAEETIDDFAFLTKEKCFKLKIEVKPNAKYVGGINLFGSKFGDYPQGIRVTATYSEP